MRFIKGLIILYAIFIMPLFAVVNVGPCAIATKGGASSMQIFATSFATLYNVFPIYIGGVPIGPTANDVQPAPVWIHFLVLEYQFLFGNRLQ